MKTETIAIDALILDPDNAREHPKDNLKSIEKSLKKFGQQKPILISKDNVVIAGNGTVMAAKELGWDTIKVVRSELTDKDAKAYAIADNRTAELAAWNKAILGKTLTDLHTLGWDLADIGFDGFKVPMEPGCDDDEIPENVAPTTKPGDLYILGDHRLLCGDSTNVQHVERLMAGEKAELCFTSPPYADQRKYNGDKDLSIEHISLFIRTSFVYCNFYAINLGISRKNGEINQYWDDYIKAAKDCGLKFLSWNIWDKINCSSISDQKAMFGISHEWIFVFGKGIKNLNRTVENKNPGKRLSSAVRMANDELKRLQCNNKFVSTHSQLKTVLSLFVEKSSKTDHPAVFPVELPETYILACTDHGQSVYEPFAGSGSTLIACEKTGRRCFGMEIDPHYCSIIVERWEKYSGKHATRES